MNRFIKPAAVALIASAIGFGAATSHQVVADTHLAPMPNLQGLPDSFADLVENVSPAVVNIAVTSTVESPGAAAQNPFQGNPQMEEYFRRYFGDRAPGAGQTRKARAVGSGFIIDANGLVVTNHHVVENATEVTVVLEDGTELPATVRGSDPKTDLALLEVKAEKPLPAVSFGDSERARVGDWVVAIGNPFGLGGTTTTGIISARGRDINSGPLDDFIQVDAAINRGNSGGPLFATDGSVIGVNTAIFSPNGGNVGIGFAVPSDQASRVIAQLRDTGNVSRGWLGVQIQSLSEELADNFGLENRDGALVSAVVPESPAERAGIVSGDVIVEFDGKPVKKMRSLPKLVARTSPQSAVPVTLIRNGERKSLDVVLAKTEEEAPVASVEQPESDLGMTVAALDTQLRQRFGIDEETTGVVVVDVQNDSKAATKGIRPGDIITAVGRDSVSNPDELAARVEAARKAERSSVVLRVGRGDSQRFVAVPIA